MMRLGSIDDDTPSAEPVTGQRSMSRREALKAGAAAISAGIASVGVADASVDAIEDLIAAAKAEGQLNLIGLPRNWQEYGTLMDRFSARYGIAINELRPNASSGYQIEAIRAERVQATIEAPDVVDIGLAFASSAKANGFLQPYKVSRWDAIPEAAKDTQGYWCGGHFGVLAFEINTDLITKIPRDWADLAGAEYRNCVGLAGYVSSDHLLQGVFAAGLSATGGNVEEAAEQGLRFFANLNQSGNFVPVVGFTHTLVDGRTPILIRWDYLALDDRDRLRGTTRIEVITPRTGVVSGTYARAISAHAPHPNAARLWLEFLYSDESQFAGLKGRRRGGPSYETASINMLDVPQQPGSEGVEVEPVFPTIEEQEKRGRARRNGWRSAAGRAAASPPDERKPPARSTQSGNARTTDASSG
jgi:putative spermidine/putrescine transport system substrate-binding protein